MDDWCGKWSTRKEKGQKPTDNFLFSFVKKDLYLSVSDSIRSLGGEGGRGTLVLVANGRRRRMKVEAAETVFGREKAVAAAARMEKGKQNLVKVLSTGSDSITEKVLPSSSSSSSYYYTHVLRSSSSKIGRYTTKKKEVRHGGRRKKSGERCEELER